jgi:hypothetical protein
MPTQKSVRIVTSGPWATPQRPLQDRRRPPHGPYQHRLLPTRADSYLPLVIRCESAVLSSPLFCVLVISLVQFLNCYLSSLQHRACQLGMENIKIPSPSTILDSPDTIPSARGKPASPPKRAKRVGTAVQKPKQTKSRNGTILLDSIIRG